MNKSSIKILKKLAPHNKDSFIISREEVLLILKEITPKKDGEMNWDEFLLYFNKVTGQNRRVISPKVKTKIKTRLKEGYTKNDIALTIKNAYNDDYHQETGYKHLTLEYISRSDTIDRFSVITNKDNNPTRMKSKI